MNNGVLTMGTAGVISLYPPVDPSAPVFAHFQPSQFVNLAITPTPTIEGLPSIVQQATSAGINEEILGTPDGTGVVVQHPEVDMTPVIAIVAAEQDQSA
jgi:hypothetical protein